MKIGHSTNIGTGGTTGGEAGGRTTGIPQNKKLAQQSIRTSGDIGDTIDKSKEILAEEDSDLEDDLEKHSEEITDEVDPEENEESSDGYEDEGNDDDINYDEPETGDPFEIEEKGPGRRERYIVEVSIKDNIPVIHFLHIPKYKTRDPLIEGAIYSRYKLFHEMAFFIGQKQILYFQSRDEEKKVNLNQTNLVDHFNKIGIKGIKDEHVSRMLDALFFQIDGCTYPAKYIFKHYGPKSQLSKKDKITLGKEFINLIKHETELTRTEKGKRFHKFIKTKRGVVITLTDNPNEYQKYRSLIDIINEAEKSQKRSTR